MNQKICHKAPPSLPCDDKSLRPSRCLKNHLTDNPDAYSTEIASEFDCHPTTIHYALKAMGYTRKKEPHLL